MTLGVYDYHMSPTESKQWAGNPILERGKRARTVIVHTAQLLAIKRGSTEVAIFTAMGLEVERTTA